MNLILDNIIFSLQRTGGLSVYWYELVRRLLASDGQVQIFNHFPTRNLFGSRLSVPVLPAANPFVLLREKYLPVRVPLSKPALFHSSFVRVSPQPGVANVVTVHDLVYEKGYIRGLGRSIHRLQKWYAFRYADGIICVSERTKTDLLSYYPELSPDRIRVIHNGVSEAFCQLPFTTVEPARMPYVLFVGDRSPYKNFRLAVEAVAQVPGYRLVVVGGKKQLREEWQFLREQLPGRFEFLAQVTTEYLNELYNRAHCLLYPSSYEGFGIPVLEAMQTGCPVVALQASSIPEVTGSAALLANRPEAAAFAHLIALLNDAALRAEIRVKGQAQAAKFSWDRCHEQTLAFYREVYARKFGAT